MNEIQGNSALILGYGREGQSVHRFLQVHFPNLRVGIADLSPVVTTEAEVTIHAGQNYLDAIAEYDTVIRSPGVSYYEVTKRKPRHLTSSANIFFSKARAHVIGITGTKGKSTTSTLIHQLLLTKYTDVRLVGNIGTPFLDELKNHTTDTWYVAELSSHQLIDLHYSVHIAVILDVTPEHLDYYPDMDAYLHAKAQVVASQSAVDWVVGNPLHPAVSKIMSKSKAQKKYFGKSRKNEFQSYLDADKICTKIDDQWQTVVSTTDLKVLGPANIENVLAAVTVGSILKLDLQKMKKILLDFTPLPHRLSSIGIYKGIEFFNDSLATTPEAVMNALEALKNRPITLIVGGYDRGLDFATLVNFLQANNDLNHLILLPQTGVKIAALIEKMPHQFSIQSAHDMKSAVELAYKLTEKGGVCVLSPGAASFNQFKDYRDRGEQFVHYVKTRP